MKVAVVGAGAAGTAAAWALGRAGAECVLVHDRPGATALTSGGLDRETWPGAHDGEALDADARLLATKLGWYIGPEPCRLVTPAGVIRTARGRDFALLDLEPLSGKRIAVADEIFDGWDGRSVARALAASSFARKTGTLFEPVAVELRLSDAERHFGSYDIAVAHDEPRRFERLQSALARGRGDHDAWLLGPWLGVRTEVAERLRSSLEMPVGETTSPLGGAAGARFERARDALLAEAALTIRRVRATKLTERGSGWTVTVDPTDFGEAEIEVERVVLALGGVAAGGILLDPARPKHSGGACFHASMEGPVELELDGEPLDSVSSLHGVDLGARGLGALERVGIAVEGASARGLRGVLVAGDCVAGRPRTLLEALRAGLAAARAAI